MALTASLRIVIMSMIVNSRNLDKLLNNTGVKIYLESLELSIDSSGHSVFRMEDWYIGGFVNRTSLSSLNNFGESLCFLVLPKKSECALVSSFQNSDQNLFLPYWDSCCFIHSNFTWILCVSSSSVLLLDSFNSWHFDVLFRVQ